MREPEPNDALKLRDYLAALKRRRKAVGLTAAASMLVVTLLAVLLPAYYQSTGTILIEQQEVPQELVRSTISSYADERVQTISQRVMTTQNLMEIIRRYDLYADRRKRDTREEVIERMRKDIKFRMISADVVDPRSGVPRQATIAFAVSYRSRSPDLAVKVANELATLYLDENLSERTRLAQDASVFLREESDRLSKRVEELETAIAAFKSKHVDALPELTQANLQLLDRTQQELRDDQMRQMSLEQQRVYLEAQLAQIRPNSVMLGDDGERIMTPADRLKMLRSQLASSEALYAPTHPDIVRLKREIAGLEAQAGAQPATNSLLRQLDEAKGELGQAREKYAPTHPDVQRLEKQVASLEAALATSSAPKADAASVPASAPTGASATLVHPAVNDGSGRENPDNPAYVQIKSQLNATLSDLRALDQQMTELRARIAEYQRKINVSPDVERDYRQLENDYETAELKYREVRSKQMEAQLAQNLEADRKGERFTLIEPPLLPEEPVSPNRPLIFILGIILSMGLAAGVAAVLESIDETVRGRRDVFELLQAAPLAHVPRITTVGDLRLARRRRRFAMSATVAAFMVALIVMHLFYMPLDVVWYSALRRLGM